MTFAPYFLYRYRRFARAAASCSSSLRWSTSLTSACRPSASLRLNAARADSGRRGDDPTADGDDGGLRGLACGAEPGRAREGGARCAGGDGPCEICSMVLRVICFAIWAEICRPSIA